MYNIPNKPEYLTPAYLLSRIKQEDIWAYYTSLVPTVNGIFRNPARHDPNPGCKFFEQSGYWWLCDFARNKKTYNCFTIIKEMYNIPYPKVLDMVYEDFLGTGSKLEYKADRIYIPKQQKEPKTISCKIQSYTKQDIEYIKSFGITSNSCNLFKVFSIEAYWIDGKLNYTYNYKDPCLGYYFGNGKWKLYHYLREEWRFICNITSDMLQGENYLQHTSDILIITKSYKDVIVLYEVGHEAVAPHSEGVAKWIERVPELNYKYKFLLFDNDEPGIMATNAVIEKVPELIPIFIPTGIKDISDYAREKGKENTKQLINTLCQEKLLSIQQRQVNQQQSNQAQQLGENSEQKSVHC